MGRLQHLKVKDKLKIIIMAACLAVLIIAGIGITACNQVKAREQLTQQLAVQARIMAESCKASVAFDDRASAIEQLTNLYVLPSVFKASVFDADGEEFAIYKRNSGSEPKNLPVLHKSGKAVKADAIAVARDIQLDKEKIGTVVIYSDLSPLYAELKITLFINIGITILALLAAYPLSMWLQKIISHPIVALTGTAKQVTEGKDYSVRAKKNTDDEIGLLIDSFNEMLNRIQKRDAKLVKANDELEKRVAERTLRLTETNEKLSAEIAQKRKTEEKLRNAKSEVESAWKHSEAVNHQLELSVEKANLLAREAQNASQTKSDFLANMSHEIRTPMNAVIGFSDLLLEEKMPAGQRKFVETIRSSAGHLLAIINDILDFSKIEAGKLEMEKIDIYLPGMLTEIQNLLQPMAEQKSLEFQIQMSPDMPRNMRTDPVRLRQCLVNLLNNAIKFTAKGHVHLNISLKHEDRPELLFKIKDTGIGISEAKQKDIFESFTQVDGSTSRKYGGTGLGLAITKRLANLLGGNLELQSEENVGSVFTLTFPLEISDLPETDPLEKPPCKRQTITPQPKNAPTGSLGPAKILLAEDSAVNQILIKILLEKRGMQIHIVEDGQQVLDLIEQDSFDLILMDIQMPNVNGYQATRRLRAMGVKTPIIALTAHAMNGDEQKCLEAGCNAYLSKPVEHDKLIATIGSYLEQPLLSGSD